MYDLTTEHNFDTQATWVIGVLFIHGCLCKKSLADVQSTCVGMKCLYCTRCLLVSYIHFKNMLLFKALCWKK